MFTTDLLDLKAGLVTQMGDTKNTEGFWLEIQLSGIPGERGEDVKRT
jgi:hypothetical protein